jgi:hypothetical protein
MEERVLLLEQQHLHVLVQLDFLEQPAKEVI